MAVNIFVTIYVLWQNISAFDLYKCYFVIFKMWFYMRQNCAVTKKNMYMLTEMHEQFVWSLGLCG